MAFQCNITALISALIVSSIMSLAFANSAFAQLTIDPSSALLLTPGSRSTTGRTSDRATTESRSDSSRYTVRPRPVSERVEKPASTQTQTTTVKQVTIETVQAPSPPPTPAPSPTPAPVVLTPTAEGAVVVVLDQPTEKARVIDDRDASVGAPQKSHLLEVSIATAYLYEHAESNYSFRQSNMGGPAYSASARAWLVSEFAVGGRYLSTLGGQVSDRGTAVSASRTELAYGVYFRNTFAQSNLVFAAEYVESEFKVSSDAVSKLKTKSSGVRVSIESEFQSPTSTWALGFSIMPKLQHEELSAATEVRSGTSVNAYAVGASVMRKWKFDSSNAVFIRLEHRLERDLFTGTATLQDPVSGATPNGVGATVGTTLIQFGYGWGD